MDEQILILDVFYGQKIAQEVVKQGNRLFSFLCQVDGQFTRNIGRSPDNQVLAQALVSIANHFEMFSVAESVESEADATFLTSIGFDCLQGYHLGAPTVKPPWQNGEGRLAG